jgi:hypothetical protein
MTIDGKAYYAITDLLKKLDIPYNNMTPGDKVGSGVKLVLTTQEEKREIDFDRILCIEDFENDLNTAKETITGMVYGDRKDILLIGVDPGLRIGIATYRIQHEVDGEVANSVQEAVSKISYILEHSQARRRIVRIGNGKMELAAALAMGVINRMGNSVEVELVDERGTSSMKTKPNRRGLRDLRSARLIALRQGTRFFHS